MGMLHSGQWRHDDNVVTDGVYRRPDSTIVCRSIEALASSIATSPGRYWLIASLSCPWSHRAMLMRALKAIRGSIPMHLAHGARLEGYALNGGAPWDVPGSNQSARHMHQLYSLHDATFTGRVTVPILWDSQAMGGYLHCQQSKSGDSRGEIPLKQRV